MPPRVSLMIHTASTDDFMEAQRIPSYFAALVKNLSAQTLHDFELVYVDTFFEENKHRFSGIGSDAPFVFKHVPVHKDHRYWYDQGYCYISAAKNTGILHADGELLVTCDDGEFFPEQLLERYWWHYKHQGRYMHALHKRMKSLHTDGRYPIMPIAGDFYVNDHRWDNVKSGVFAHRHGTWLFAGTSFSLEDALQLNGFNERMDGCKSLEDCDFGCRLRWLGRSFALDPEGWLAIVDHPNYSDIPTTIADGQQTALPPVTRRKIDNFIAVENHGMLRCGQLLPEPIANKQPITQAHLEIMQRETLKYRKFDPLGPENADKLAVWLKTPMFDLRAQRAELRNSKDWIW